MIRCAVVLLAALIPGTSVAHAAAPRLDRADLEAWADGLLPYALENGDIAGAVIVVVKDGEVLLEKGYGYADREKRIPVDPERTLFRPGSVSKLFTWTAVMQLVEQGKLDLDRDVNDYLDFKIAPAFGRPVTLRTLMTHTPGFEEPFRGLLGWDLKSLLPLEDYFKLVTPARIFPPGEVPSYSNYGVALAGYIVQRISGEDFDTYIERHVFTPIGMEHATFRQPLPARLAPDMSKGYRWGSAGPMPYDLYGVAPAGSSAVTAADMARFMIAHLQAEKGQSVLLGAEAARQMHRWRYQGLPPLKGMSLGFFDFSRNGHQILWHGGDTVSFHSDLNLLIDDGVGLFLSMNTAGSNDATDAIRTAWAEGFEDRYFPRSEVQGSSDSAPRDPPTAATAREHAKLLIDANPWQSSRRNQTSFFAFADLFSQEKISMREDGSIVTPFAQGLDGEPKTWREIGPFLWRDTRGPDLLAVRVKDGRVDELATEPSSGYQVRQPVPAMLSATWNVPLLITAVSVLFLTVVAWPFSALARRHYSVLATWTQEEAALYRALRLVALIDLAYLAGWAWLFGEIDSNWAVFEGRRDLYIRFLQLLGIVGLVGAAVAVLNVRVTWRGARGWRSRLWSVLLAIACLVIAWISFAFNLLSLTLRY